MASVEATMSRGQHSANISRPQNLPHNTTISAHSNPDLTEFELMQPPYAVKAGRNLPRSTTMESLLSSTRDTAPRRSLLQPLGPPLPRSQTLGSMSCLNGNIATPSPRAPDPSQLKALRRRTGPETFLDTATELKKSQKIDTATEEVSQVQREAAIQRRRLRNNITAQPHGKSAYPVLQNTQTIPGEVDESLVRSPCPTMGMPVEGQNVQQQDRRRKLSINFPLSTKPQLEKDCLPFSLWKTNKNITNLPQGSSENVRLGLPFKQGKKLTHSQVTKAEGVPYWAGRFVAICDKLRATECEQNEKRPLVSNNDEDNRLDAQDKTRMCNALNVLRRCCQTSDALRSFETFELEFRNKTDLGRTLNHATSRVTPERQGDAAFQGGKPNKLRKFRAMLQSPNLISPVSSDASSLDVSCEAKFYGQGTLAKSKTTGNLASLLPMIHRKAVALTAGFAHSEQDAQSNSHKSPVSTVGYSPGPNEKAPNNREERLSKPVAEDLIHSGTWRDSKCTGSDRSGDVTATSRTRGATIKHRRVSSFILVSTQSLESPNVRIDHVRSTAAGSKDEARLSGSEIDTQVPKGPGLGRKSERQFSGEMVKSFFGAGIREMKKMSRRVSGGIT
ncbi:hypothetical protein PV10_00165 [Exophiala mesophila]|uniref:Uncharacterized protein n=1 Tax=Exophiala mesophila TaxID=212818 RepID=A0A0D1ZNQ7_EXOME|nr:uncharacterized protein PV10_00165 [Exophiala mesophila]KIV96282.1 hypothetical protein PV10_00165 [Exophiala mesophila]